MTASYKFGIGTEVYVLHDNQVKKLKVSYVSIGMSGVMPVPVVNYKLTEGHTELSNWFSEAQLFRTKAALFRSL